MLKSLKRKNLFHRVLSIVLVVAFVISLIPGYAVKADEASNDVYDVSSYKGEKSQDKWTYPTKEGYIFAGWYTDNTYETIYTEKTGNATAKFVDAKVLTLKKQLLPSTNGTTVSVRFMTAVDSEKFQKIVFEVSAGETGREFVLEERTAWSSVVVDGVTDTRTAADVFGTEAAKYFVLHSISGIPRAAFDEVFTATPYWYTQDGTKVQGTPAEFTINDTIWNYTKYTFTDNADRFVVSGETANSNGQLSYSSLSCVQDETASDGYALKVERESGVGGVRIYFDNLEVADYSSITLKMRLTENSGTNNLYISSEGKYLHHCEKTAYESIELVQYLTKDTVNISELKYIEIRNDSGNKTPFYIDGIEFVVKSDCIDYSKVNYQFANYQEMQVVSNVGSTTTAISGETGAKDGYALKVTKPANQGVVISFNGLTVADYDKIILRIKKTGEQNLYINANYQSSSSTGTYLSHVEKNANYQEIDLMQLAEMANGTITTLNNLYMQNGYTETFYIDEIVFVEKVVSEEKPNVTYQFASEDDMSVVTSTGDAWARLASDDSATDKSALYCTTDGSKTNSGVSIAFDNLDVTKYEHIYVKIKTNGSVCIGINGAYKDYQSYANYTTVDLLSYITSGTLQSASVYRDTASVGIYIDEITFVEKVVLDYDKLQYTFADEYELLAASSYGNSTISRYEDSLANDGSALKVQRSGTGGVTINFDALNVADYESIVIRMKKGTNNLYIYANGDADANYLSASTSADYTDIELINNLDGKITTLNYLVIKNDNSETTAFYIDGIRFVTKKDKIDYSQVDYTFDTYKEMAVVKSYNGGNVKGLVPDEKANDGWALKGVTGTNHSASSGIQILFNNLNVAQYESVKIRFRAGYANGTYSADTHTLYYDLNGTTYVGDLKSSIQYVEVDLAKMARDKNITVLESFEIGRQSLGSIEIYIDEITFVSAVPTYAALTDPLNQGLELSLFAAPTIATLESFQTVRNTGAKTIYLNDWAGYTLDSEKLTNVLQLCEQVGLNAYWMTNNDSSIAAEDLKDMLSATTDYTTFNAFKGFYALDEPHEWQMRNWLTGNIDEWNASKYKDYNYLVNLFVHDICYYDNGENAHYYDTEAHLDNYWNHVLSKNPNKILMYDYYPMCVQWDESSENVVLNEKTLHYLNRFAQYTKNKREDSTADASDMKLYTFLQTFAPWRDSEATSGTTARTLTSVRDVRFNVAYNLAYGSKGFACFDYERQSDQQTGSTMIEPDGTKNNSYYYVQKVFNELRDWENVYCAFDWQGTMAIDGTATGDGVQDASHISSIENNLTVNDIDRLASVETEHDLLVGTFEDSNGYDGFLITSYVDPYYNVKNHVEVTFNKTSKALIYYNGELMTNDEADSCYILNDGKLDIDLKAGDYLFVIPLV